MSAKNVPFCNAPILTTDDAAIVAILGLHGLHPRAVDVSEDGSRKVWFRFEHTPFVNEIIESYNRGAAQVSAKLFILLYRDAIAQMRRQQAAAVKVSQ